MIRTSLITAGALVAFAGAASAADHTISIDTALADFSDPSETQVVYDRVVEAAETVCQRMYMRSVRSTLFYSAHPDMVEACVSSTIEDALAGADIAALTELHQSTTTEAFEVALQ